MAFDIELGTMTAFMESSGENAAGQRAVCHVLANRLTDGRWGNTLASVVLWPFQFSCWLNDDPNRHRMAVVPDTNPILVTIKSYLQAALDGSDSDITQGAMWYFNPKLAAPSWTNKLTLIGQFGSMNYYR